MHHEIKRAMYAAVFATAFGCAYGLSGMGMGEPPVTKPATPPAKDTVKETAKESAKPTLPGSKPVDTKPTQGVATPATGQATPPAHHETLEPVLDLSQVAAIDLGCWSELRTRRIYFAHQAVGSDMIAGLHEVMRLKPESRMSVVAYAEPDKTDAAAQSAFDAPAIVEGLAGRRGDPEKKIDEFARFLRSDEGSKVDIAVLKLCFGDIGRNTDAAALAARYQKAVDEIRRERPNIHFIHCTVPLKAEEPGTRGRMKRLVGAGSNASNAVRARYNEEIRRRFPAEQVFDIAAVESRRPDGSEATVEVNGKRVQALAAEYTEDGAQLNRVGRMILAREFLVTLSHQCGGVAAKESGIATGASAGEPGGK